MNGVDDREKYRVGVRHRDNINFQKGAVSDGFYVVMKVDVKHGQRHRDQTGQTLQEGAKLSLVGVVMSVQSFGDGLPRVEQWATILWLVKPF